MDSTRAPAEREIVGAESAPVRSADRVQNDANLLIWELLTISFDLFRAILMTSGDLGAFRVQKLLPHKPFGR